MGDIVKARKRGYQAPKRVAQAAATRHAILAAARDLFVDRGYTKTTVADVAAAAGVATDTVYATVGRKPVLLRLLIETALSGTDEVVPAVERGYVKAIRVTASAEHKIQIYADALREIQQRLAPIFLVLREAASTDADCASLWAEISARRARNMRDFATELRATGQLREDLTDDEVADVVWSMNAVEYWTLLVVERGWSPERFGRWLADAWIRLLVEPESRPPHQRDDLEPRSSARQRRTRT